MRKYISIYIYTRKSVEKIRPIWFAGTYNVYLMTISYCAGLAQWIGRVTLNVVNECSIPRSRLKIYNWVAPLWLVYILHISQCLFELMYEA